MLVQLNGFFAIVEQMSAVDTGGIEPLYTPLSAVQEVALRLRDDAVTEADEREANQRNAPAVADGLYPRAAGDRMTAPSCITARVWPSSARALGRRSEVSSVELTTHLLARLRTAHNDSARCSRTTTSSRCAGGATPTPASRRGEHGPLIGVPIAHKDIFVTRELPTTAGSKMLAGYRSPFDATVVPRLAAAGMVTLGKLNCDEFAMGSIQRELVVSHRCATRGTRAASRAVRRAGRPRRWRRGCCPRPPAPTPAARSASRRASPASPASSPPTEPARATG